MDQKLPALPASDPTSIEKNRYDGFYNVKSREFWRGNEINSCGPEDNIKICNHFFVPTPGGVSCRKCGTGYIGLFEIQNGKLFYEGLEVGI